MAVELQFSVEGSEIVSRRLGITAEGVTDFKKPFSDVGKTLLKTFDTNFDSRGREYSAGWAPRKPQYKKGVRIDTWPLLEKSGDMRGGFRKKLTKWSLELYNTQSYFKYHQSNAPRKSNLPRRVMMKLREQDATMIVKSFQAYLVELSRKAGTR